MQKFLPRLIVSTLLLLIAACASNADRNQPEPVPVPPINLAGNTMIVLPASTLHREVADISEGVQAELVRQLGEHGFNAYAISQADFSVFHQSALEIGGAIYDPSIQQYFPLKESAYAKSLATSLRERGQFDAMILAELVLRDVPVVDGIAVWDGARVPVEIGQETSMLRTKGLSIRLSIYDVDGNQIGQSFGGILLPFKGRGAGMNFRYELNKDINNAFIQMQAAAAIALQPIHKK